MSDMTDQGRAGIISAVNNPLGFFVLGLLIVDGTIATLAVTLSDFRHELIWTIIISNPLFLTIVVWLAIWRPEALRGDRPLQDSHAQQFASILYHSLEGSFSNLEKAEREEAWITIIDVFETENDSDVTYRTFCISIGKKLARIRKSVNRRRQNDPSKNSNNEIDSDN